MRDMCKAGRALEMFSLTEAPETHKGYMRKAVGALEMFSLTEAPETHKGYMRKAGGAWSVCLYWLESENESESDIASRANIKEPAKETKEKNLNKNAFQ